LVTWIIGYHWKRPRQGCWWKLRTGPPC
jgi:hypothetical protein